MSIKLYFSFAIALVMMVTSFSGLAQNNGTRRTTDNRGRAPQLERPPLSAPVIIESQTFDLPLQLDYKIDISQLLCDVSIPQIIPAELENVAVKCWDGKPFDNTDGVGKLWKEKKVCDCLRKHDNTYIKDRMNSSTSWASAVASNLRKTNLSETEAQRIQRERSEAVRAQVKYLQRVSDSYGFQASTIGIGDGDLFSAYSGVGRVAVVKNVTPPVDAHSFSHALNRALGRDVLESTPAASTPNPREGNSSASRSAMNVRTAADTASTLAANEVVKASEPNRALYEDQRFDPEMDVCIGSREYLAFKQLPSDPRLFREFSKPFNQKDWNYDSLRQEFSQLTSMDKETKERNRDRILTLRAKILYLSRNPMIKAILSDYSNPPTGDDADSVRIRESMKDLNLAQEQQALFSVLSGVVPNDNNCRNGRGEEGACLNAATEAGLVENYKNKLGQFFANPKIGAYTMYKGTLDVNKAAAEYSQNGGSYQTNVDKIKTYDALEEDFVNNTGLAGPSQCANGGENISDCLDIYAPFCQRLDTVIAYSAKGDSLVDDIDVQIRRNLDPELETNPDLLEFNRQMCLEPRRTGRFSGDAINFRQYRDRICANPGNRPECKADTSGYQLLRQRFHTEYQYGQDNSMTKAFARVRTRSVSRDAVDRVANSSPTSMETSLRNLGQIEEKYISQFGSGNISSPQAQVPASTVASSAAVSPRDGGSNSSSMAASDEPLYNTLVNSSAMISPETNQMTRALPSSAENLSEDDRERIRSLAEEEIARTQKQIPNAATSAEKENLEQQNKLLQELLAQKSETESKYQQLIDQLNKRNQELSQPSVVERTAQTAAPKRNANQGTTFVNPEEVLSDVGVNRAPASADTSAFNTAGANNGNQNSGRASSSFGGNGNSAASSRSSIGGANSALLDAAIARGRASSDGGAIIVQEADRGVVSAIENASINGPQLSLTVPAQAFTQFQNENVEVLRQYKEQILKSVEVDQAVRLTVRNGDKTMNIVVVNRNGNLVYVPNRVFSLKSLNQQLRVPAGQNP